MNVKPLGNKFINNRCEGPPCHKCGSRIRYLNSHRCVKCTREKEYKRNPPNKWLEGRNPKLIREIEDRKFLKKALSEVWE